MTNCPLCMQYDFWRDRNLILFEDAGATAIVSIEPVVPGQILLFPKGHQTNSRGSTNWYAYQDRAFEALQRNVSLSEGYLPDIYEYLAKSGPYQRSKDLSQELLRNFSTHNFSEAPTGFHFGQNRGISAGQTLDHLHGHIFPTFGEEPLPGIVTKVQNYYFQGN